MSMMIHRSKKRRMDNNSGTQSHESYPFSSDVEDNAKLYEQQPKKQYTKTEVNRMSTTELQNLAAESGIENAYDKSGGELKKMLIEKFGL